jgi:glycosyltransferase involved in cell wall biosynthesis
MEKAPKISIITVTYNSVRTLERTILSVIKQNYANLEYIIVDGGSKDGTLDIIEKYHEYITAWVSEPDKGISDAFNKGIAMATGDVIGIINSDDGLLPGALDAVADAYEKDVDVYRGNMEYWNEEKDTRYTEKPSMHFRYDGRNRIDHSSTFVSKAAYEEYGVFDVECHYVMDYDLLMRFEKAGAKFKHIDETLAFFTLGGVTFTPFIQKRRKEIVYMLRKNGANTLQVGSFFVVKYLKMFINKVFGKDRVMKVIMKEKR